MSSHSSPLKQNQSGYSSPSKANGNIRYSPNKSTKNSKKTTIVSSPIAAQSVADTQSFRSQRSIVETVEEKVDPKLIEEKNKSKLNKIINESPNIEKDATSPTLLYVEIGPTLSISNLFNLSRRLVVLRLTGTELPKPSIPLIESLRTLFLDQCKLKSLEGFPLFPKLRYLNLSRNSLETFKGFPVYPDLEEFDIRNNKVEFNVDLALAAIASVSMNIYNGKKINENQIRQAFSRSPLIGYSLRQGFPAFTNEKSSKKSKGKKNSNTNEDEALTMDANNFLINQLLSKITSEGITTTSLLVNNESATVTLPIKGTNIKWFINTQPSDKHPSEWEHVPKSAVKKSERKTGNQLSQIITITQMMYQHLIRCEFSLSNDTTNRRYSMYTLNVIGHEINKDKNELILPFPINPQVTGEPYEDSLVSLVPMPVPCHVSWYLEDKLLHKGDHSIRLKEEYIDHEVSCLLQPYCKNMPEITFTHLLAKTNPVERLDPVVTNVYFPDDIIEGIEIKFEAHVLPNREGQSEITIERAVSPSANWEKIKVLQPFSCNYTPTIDDVGCFLRCSYLPILNDGTRPSENKPTIFYSKSRVIPGFPAFKNPMIAGDAKAGHSLVAIASYFGGRKGVCHYKWYKSPQKFKISSNSSNENLRRTISLSKMPNATVIERENTAILSIEKNLVGLYIAVEMTPIRNDDTIGEKVVACLNTPISQGGNLTPLKKLPPNDQIVAYKPINVKIPVVWYRTNPDWRDSNGSATGFEKIFTGQEYTPTDRDVGNFLRLMTTKGESDVIIGEVKPSIPFIYSFELNIKGRKCEVGSVAEVPRKAISINSFNDDDYDDIDEDDDNGNEDYSGDGENGDGEESRSSPRNKKKKKADNTYIKGVPKTALSEYYEDMKRRKKVEIVWVRMTKNNPNDTDYIERVVDIDTTTYTFTKMDVNSYIKAVVYPLDDEGNRFPPTHSKPTRLIKAVEVKQPVMKGDLKVGGFLSIDFKDFPIYSLIWERTKKMKWEPIYTFTFDHFDGDTPMYKLDKHKEKDDDKDKFYTNLDYVVKKVDIDYHIQAEIVVGEIREIPDPSNPNQTILTMVPSELVHGTLKSSLDSNGKVSTNTEGDKTKSFTMMERVVPDDLRISLSEETLREPITEGKKVEVKIDGADSKGKKPEILWETKVIKVRKSKTDKNKNEEYEKWEVLYKGPSHTFTSDDLNNNFRIRCANNDQIINIGFIQPSLPKISDFTIKQDNNGSIVILNAKYHGGIEGKSLYFYSLSSNVQNTTGTTTSYSYNDDDLSYIDNATLNFKKLKKVVKIKEGTADSEHPVRMFTPTKDMFNKRIDIGIIPVRSDDPSIQGKVRWSTNSIVVKSIPIVDAVMKYPNDDVDHLQVGMPITCTVTRCSMKNCSYKFTWKRYRPQNNRNSDDDNEDENNFVKEEIKSNTTINNSSTYKLRQIDDNCFIICQIVAVSENGFLSPIFILDSYQIILPGMKDYTLSISIPSRQGIADVKATKRSSGSLSRSDKIEGEIDTGDTLTPILNPEPKKGFSVQYEWQILSETQQKQQQKSPKKNSKKKNSNLSENLDENDEENDEFDDFGNNEGNKWTTVSMEDSYTCSVLDLGCMIRCVCTIEGKNYSDMFESIPIGPVKINPKIEAPARSIIRANSFKMNGKAPSGNGQWDFLINSKGITITKVSTQSSTTRINSNNEQFVKWPNVVCNLLPDEENQIEISTGPAMRIIIIPKILDKKRVAPNIQKNEVRDFCIFIINQFKKKDNENASNPA